MYEAGTPFYSTMLIRSFCGFGVIQHLENIDSGSLMLNDSGGVNQNSEFVTKNFPRAGNSANMLAMRPDRRLSGLTAPGVTKRT